MHKHQLGCYQYINWKYKQSVILGKVVKPFLMAINRIQDHNILLILGHKFFIPLSFTICSVFLDKCISCDFCDYLKQVIWVLHYSCEINHYFWCIDDYGKFLKEFMHVSIISIVDLFNRWLA